MNTAVSTSVMPMSAPVICSIALRVASRGGRPSSCMRRSTFSTTTIASSTRMPMASTTPNSVSTLIENPNTYMLANEPSSATGMTMVGISVARRFCRNRYITRNTNTMASSRVSITSSDRNLDERRRVHRVAHTQCRRGKNLESSAIFAFTAVAVDSALAEGVSLMRNARAGSPSARASML